MKLSNLFVLCAAVTLAGCSTTPSTEISLIDKGQYIADVDNMSTMTGLPAEKLAIISNISFIDESNLIPAQKGTRFGISYNVSGEKTDVIHKATFPKMSDPTSGKVLESFSYSKSVTEGNDYFGYNLSEDWEVIPGTWTLSIIHNGQVVIEEEFILEKPSI